MVTCESCEFWEAIRDGFGDCALILDDTTGQSLDKAQITIDTLDDTAFARLLTHKTFGCTLHQPERR